MKLQAAAMHAAPSKQSMTGFGCATGVHAGRAWSWELRSVNARGLDIRLRLPAGWDSHDQQFRQLIAAALHRGSVTATLSLSTHAAAPAMVRADVLEQVLAIALDLARRIDGAPPPRAEVLLALPGVLQPPAEPAAEPDPELTAVIEAGLRDALSALVAARAAEGARLTAILQAQTDHLASLAAVARVAARDQPAAQAARLTETLATLLGDVRLDAARLAQEVALLATRADVTEELDRLDSHIAEARTLLQPPDPAGRRLDFLAQEFMREANTLCSKSATTALTRLGLDLKAAIEQWREQVQNLA